MNATVRDDYRSQIRNAASAVRISLPAGFRWLGKEVEVLPPTLHVLDQATVRPILVSRLTDTLYRWFYTQGGVARPERAKRPGDSGAFARMCQETLAAQWQGPALQRADGYLSLDRDLGWPSYEHRFVRVYLNAGPSCVASLAARIAFRLDAVGVRFLVKFLDDIGEYDRCDTCVLYLHAADLETVMRVFGTLDLAAHDLRQGAPAFTRMLMPGVGLAEDPSNGQSFGVDRCESVAEGVVRCAERSITNVEGILEVVVECFSERGLSVRAPYLPARRREEVRCDSDRDLAVVDPVGIDLRRGTRHVRSRHREVRPSSAFPRQRDR